jgi:predicted metal-dependent phosphotriesterase family hydrolase
VNVGKTVLWDIEETQLGVTLMHERLALEMYRTSRRRDQLLAGVDVIADEIGQLRDAGGGAIVELTTRAAVNALLIDNPARFLSIWV